MTSDNQSTPLVVDGVSRTGSSQLEARAQPQLFIWSAADEEGIKRIARVYRSHLAYLLKFPQKVSCS